MRPLKRITSLSILAALSLLSANTSRAQNPNAIGVNLTFGNAYNGDSSTVGSLVSVDPAGVFLITNWNNVLGAVTGGGGAWQNYPGLVIYTNNLQDSLHANSGAALTITGVANGWVEGTAANPPSPNFKLMHDVWEINLGGAANAAYTGTNTYYFTNLPSTTYDVYVYLGSEDSSRNIAVQCLNDGVTYYQNVGSGGATDPMSFTLGNNTSLLSFPTANYVMFSAVSLDSLKGISIVDYAPAGQVNRGGITGIELIPTGSVQQSDFLAFAQNPVDVNVNPGQTATFTAVASGTGTITYQWYEITADGTSTNTVGSTTTSYTTPTLAFADSGEKFFVVANNGTSSATGTVARLTVNLVTGWQVDAGGSWGTAADWSNSVIASGSGAVALFTIPSTADHTVTLDANYTIGSASFGNGASAFGWTINPGSPAGTLNLIRPVPVSVTGGGNNDTVVGATAITVASGTIATINAPISGTNGLNVTGNGKLILAGNNSFTGPTIIGFAKATDITEVQLGNGGATGNLDLNPANDIWMAGFTHLIYNRSDTTTLSNVFNNQPVNAANVIVNSGTLVLTPQAARNPWLGAVVNSSGTLVLNCPTNNGNVTAINNTGGSIDIATGLPRTVAQGNSGNQSLAINSGGTVKLAGPGGNGVNIATGVGVLDNGAWDLGGVAVQVRSVAGSGLVTNSGATTATLRLGSTPVAGFPWNGHIADGASAKTAVIVSSGNQTFTSPNPYSGDTTITGGSLILSNSASIGSANVFLTGGNFVLTNTPTLAANVTVYVGSGRTFDFRGVAGFTLGSGQSLVVTNTGIVQSNLTAAAGSTLVPGGVGVAGTMTHNGTLTLNGNTNKFDLAAAATEGGGVNDEIIVNGNLTLSGNVTIVVNTNFNGTLVNGSVYKLIKYSGTLANTAAFTVVPATVGGLSLSVDTTVNPGYISLDVTGPPSAPQITATSPTNVATFVGYPATLSVTAAGVPTPQYQWFGGPGAGTLIPGATAPSFTFTPVATGVTNFYCHVFNNQGSTNGSFTVTIYSAPSINVQLATGGGTYAANWSNTWLYLTDVAGFLASSNWNFLGPLDLGSDTAARNAFYPGASFTNLLSTNGFVTPVSLTVVGMQNAWGLPGLTPPGTRNSDPNYVLMDGFWDENTAISLNTNLVAYTFTNFPVNTYYDAYVYVGEENSDGAHPSYLTSQGITNYFGAKASFSGTYEFGTADTSGAFPLPVVNAIYLQKLATGPSGSFTIFQGVGNVVGISGMQVTPSDPGPAVLAGPVSAAINAGTSFTNSVNARGNGTLFYQWYQIAGGVTNVLGNGGHILGATSAGLVLNPAQGSDNGGYFVVVTNAFGSVTSAVASLTVYTVPVITAQSPTDAKIYAGRSPTFFVTAAGPATLHYQWRTNGVEALGGTSSTFTLNNVQLSASGKTLACVVTNSFGSVTSSVITLTVLSPPSGTYAAVVLSDNPIAYLRLNEADDAAGNNGAIAHDYAGAHNGVYSNVVLGVTGFPFPEAAGDTAAQFAGGAGSYAGGIPIDFAVANGGNAAFSVEAWVNGATQPNHGIVTKGFGHDGQSAPFGEQFSLQTSTGGGNFAFDVTDASGNPHVIFAANDGLHWHHLVGVCDQANGFTYIYRDGQLISSGPLTPGSGLLSSALPVSLGSKQTGASADYDGGFVGTVDEVAIYNYALSSNAVLNHYYAAGIPPAITQQPLQQLGGSTNAPEGSIVALTAVATGTPPLHYQWYDNNGGSPIAKLGATNSSLVFSNVNSGNIGSGTWFVDVTNAYGDANLIAGSPTLATINIVSGPPFILQDLSGLSRAVYAGVSLTYSIGVSGTSPFYYQWHRNGIDVPSATNSSYTFAALLGTNMYSVTVTNAQGSAPPSSTNTVIGVPAPTSPYAHRVLADLPLAYWRLGEGPDNGTGNNGVVAHDYIGGFDGTYNNVMLGVSGYNPIIDPDTATYFGASGSSYVGSINGISFVQPNGQNSQFSVELWCNGPAAQAFTGGDGPALINQGPAGADSFGIDVDATGTGFRFNTHNAAGTWVHPQTTATVDGNWHYVVGVCDEAAGTVYLYVDGVATTAAIAAGSGFTATAGTDPVSIGARNSGANDGTYPQYFLGTIDEVAIYNYALSSNQVAAHYALGTNSSVSISVRQILGGKIVLTWPTGTLQSATNVAGPYTTNDVVGATSPYTNTISGPKKFFRVHVP